MMGYKARRFGPIGNLTLEELVPEDHFYRHLEQSLDQLQSRSEGMSIGAARAPCWAAFKRRFTLAECQHLPAARYDEAAAFVRAGYQELGGGEMSAQTDLDLHCGPARSRPGCTWVAGSGREPPSHAGVTVHRHQKRLEAHRLDIPARVVGDKGDDLLHTFIGLERRGEGHRARFRRPAPSRLPPPNLSGPRSQGRRAARRGSA